MPAQWTDNIINSMKRYSIYTRDIDAYLCLVTCVMQTYAFACCMWKIKLRGGYGVRERGRGRTILSVQFYSLLFLLITINVNFATILAMLFMLQKKKESRRVVESSGEKEYCARQTRRWHNGYTLQDDIGIASNTDPHLFSISRLFAGLTDITKAHPDTDAEHAHRNAPTHWRM